MTRILVVTLIILLLLFLMPLLFLPLQAEGDSGSDPAPSPASGDLQDGETQLKVKTEEGVITLSMDTYLWRVVAAEMPATFHIEALKAQTIAARTYAYYKLQNGPPSKHLEADLCTSSSCCSAYITPENAMARWGTNGEAYATQITAAVTQTDGQAILYNESPIDAVYHSSSSGATEDAALVWGSTVPYLSSVASPETADTVPNFTTTVEVPADAFRETLLAQYPQADFSGEPDTWITDIQYSDAGKVLQLTIGGVTVTGKSMRSMFSLRSTTFDISPVADAIVFSVSGYGHGVGMSQYGANTMAQEGKTCEEILLWYYTGTTIGSWSPAS